MSPDLTAKVSEFSRKYYQLSIYANPPSEEKVKAQEFLIKKDRIALEDRLLGVFDFEDHHEVINI